MIPEKGAFPEYKMCIKRKKSAPPSVYLQAVRFCVFLYAGSIDLAFRGVISCAVPPLLFPDVGHVLRTVYLLHRCLLENIKEVISSNVSFNC